MRLDTSHMRYLSRDDFRVLSAAEYGSKNHEIIPTNILHQLGGLRSTSATNRSISELAKIGLISKMRNAKYDGYRLTYHGYDYLALKSFLNRKTVYSTGNQIGIGKESDIFTVGDDSGKENVLKLHRLGRISFRSIKNNRDYIKAHENLSWKFLSKIAAEKEFAFMKALYENGFSVPVPIDQSRHCIIMSLIDGTIMRRVLEHDNPGRLYQTLMEFIVRLANHGLIHCDFNEFNILIRDNFDTPEQEIVVIDFPQCISISHVDAKRYFDRDVESIRSFFKRKLNYECDYFPDFERDIKREKNLDILVNASGFSKKEVKEYELAMAASLAISEEDLEAYDRDATEDFDNETQYNDDQEYEENSDDEDSEEESEEESDDDDTEEVFQEAEKSYQERLEEAIIARGIENIRMDKLGNYLLTDEE